MRKSLFPPGYNGFWVDTHLVGADDGGVIIGVASSGVRGFTVQGRLGLVARVMQMDGAQGQGYRATLDGELVVDWTPDQQRDATGEAAQLRALRCRVSRALRRQVDELELPADVILLRGTCALRLVGARTTGLILSREARR